jgi:hypothetical protein
MLMVTVTERTMTTDTVMVMDTVVIHETRAMFLENIV